MTMINECGHPERKHSAFGKCKSCYDMNRNSAPERRAAKAKYDSKYVIDHKDERAAYKLSHKAEITKYRAEYYRMNKTKETKRHVEYKRKRYHNDIDFKLTELLRSRLRLALKRDSKSGSAVGDLGCSIRQFKLYIENQFESGMSWDNYGEWHLDHVQPLSSFDLTDRSQFITACNWLNYQPLWASDNIRKGALIQGTGNIE